MNIKSSFQQSGFKVSQSKNYCFYNVYYNQGLKSLEFNILLHNLSYKEKTEMHLKDISNEHLNYNWI